MSSMVRHVCAVVTSLSLVGLAAAQGTQGTTTKPGTVPVPQSSQDKSGFGSSSQSTATPATTPAKAPTPAKAAAKHPEAIQSTKRFAEHTGLVRTSEVVGLSVKDAAGKDAGKIEDLLMDARGDVAYAVVSFGGLLGVGDKLYAVPWNAFMVDREHKTAYLDVSKATLENAPSFSRDRWPAASDREWGSSAHSAWNDASITAGVKARLAREKAATLLKVNVDTNQGVVELKGSVDSEHTKQRATELARQVDGVRKVVNNLRVQG
jgi:BON domain/PRC-barrel domain